MGAATSSLFTSTATTTTSASTAAVAATSSTTTASTVATKRFGAAIRRRPRRRRAMQSSNNAHSFLTPALRAAIAANEAEDSEADVVLSNALVTQQQEQEQQQEVALSERLTPVILALADDPQVIAAVSQSAAVQQFLHSESDLILGIGEGSAGVELRLFDTSSRAIAAGEFVELVPDSSASPAPATAAASAPNAEPAEAPRLTPFHSFLEQRRELLLKVVLPTAIAIIVARAVPSVSRAREIVSSVFGLAVSRWFQGVASASA